MLKQIIFTLLSLLSIQGKSQQLLDYSTYKIQPTPVILCFFGGAFKGYSDVLNYHYSNFKKIHPNINDQFWNPELSWTNKYKNHDSLQGPQFWQSTKLLVAFTDVHHASNSLSKYCVLTAIIIKIGDKKRSIKYYLTDALIYSVQYNAGFWSTYEIIYK